MEYPLIWFPTYVLVGMLVGMFRFNQVKKLFEKGKANQLTGRDKEKYDDAYSRFSDFCENTDAYKPLVVIIFALFWLPLELYFLSSHITSLFDREPKNE